jgi:hypothetical protein
MRSTWRSSVLQRHRALLAGLLQAGQQLRAIEGLAASVLLARSEASSSSTRS